MTRLTRRPTTRGLFSVFALATAVYCSPVASAQQVLMRQDRDLVAVPALPTGLGPAIQRLFAGPDPTQRSRGIVTSIPAGTRCLSWREHDGDLELSLSAPFLLLCDKPAELEAAIEQIAKSLLPLSDAPRLRIRVRDQQGQEQALDAWLPAAHQPRAGAGRRLRGTRAGGSDGGAESQGRSGVLSGKTIVISPGHGYYKHSTLGWTTQRPLIDGLIEDIHTAEIAHRFLIPALENMGARVISCRERGEITQERYGNDEYGSPNFVMTGNWSTFTSGGLNNSYYRSTTTTTSATPTATATYEVRIFTAGIYPVYAFFPASSNASTDARYTIHHSGGSTEVEISQRGNDKRWTHLGNFHFDSKGNAKIVLDNRSSSTGRVLVADAIRIGGGFGSISRGTTSGKPRWQEAARYWTQFVGAPSSVYNTAGGEDNNDDVTARPRYAEWRGADAFLSLHTNAGGGAGTSSFIYSGTPSAGSATFQSVVHSTLVQQIRSLYDSSWTDRGRKSANFGEVRVLRTMPGVLLELAFHDTQGSKDHRALHDPEFRFLAGRAIARGIMRYFSRTAAFPPEAPVALRVTQDGQRGLQIAWDPSLNAVGYSVEVSLDGKGFVELGQTSRLSLSTGPLPPGTVRSFRVSAFNSSGYSFPTEVLSAGTAHTKDAQLLMVQGFDRWQRTVKSPENTKDYLAIHAAAIQAARAFSLGFDAASNEAVQRGRVQLGHYQAVNWQAGEESTKHESFNSQEQSLLAAYHNAGGHLLISGSEIGWDLQAKGTAADAAFFNGVLGVRYVADDANTYSFSPSPGTHLASGMSAGSFDDGSGPTYDVDYADVITPADSRGQLCLRYGTGGGAALQRQNAAGGRLVFIGFPFETIRSTTLQAELMGRALRYLLPARALVGPATTPLGGSMDFDLQLPGHPGADYLMVTALQLGALPLPNDVLVPLQYDPLFEASLIAPSVFVNYRGKLDVQGRAQAAFKVPNIAAGRGLSVYTSGVRLDASLGFAAALPWTRTQLQ